jgi:2-oxoglutarate decarboxylase
VESDVDQIIADEFGANASYVGDLLHRFEQDPMSVDEEWRSFFETLLANWKPGSAEPAGLRGEQAGSLRSQGGSPGGPLTPGASTAAEPRREAAPVQQAGAISKPEAEDERIPLRGPALRVAENMQSSLAVPTAASQRQVPVKLLEENRRLINQRLQPSGRKVSFTHIIARAILKAIERFPQMNDAFEQAEKASFRVRHRQVTLGIAVDVTRKDGTRSLLVPNIKGADRLAFPELLDAYDSVVARARSGQLQVSDFQGTTVSLTNPGTIGTTASNPRLMPGQGLIVATGAIDYAPEYHAMSAEALSRLGISKVMTLTSTYDHRIIQGAESGAFLALIDELLRGEHEFYEQIFAELGMQFRPYRWAVDRNPALLGERRYSEEIRKQASVWELINAYRVRGHLVADINPLRAKEIQYHPELDIATYGLTIWDLDREFLAGGLGLDESATLREIVERLRSYYCGKFGIEYRNIQMPDEKEWLRSRVEREQPAVPDEARQQILWKLISAELFEKFLGTKYLGQKRFSIEGAESVIALLDQLIEGAARRGIDDITIGMSHRGRLNVIANVIGRFCERIFTIFEGSIHPKYPHDQGDVKYHQGASGTREVGASGTREIGASGTREIGEGLQVALTVLPNPSHLEFVDPVVEGVVRAKQDLLAASVGGALEAPLGAQASSLRVTPDSNPIEKAPADSTSTSTQAEKRYAKLPVLVHGDAAFAGEGIVAETLNLSGLPGYETGGTIHLIVNNQLGFTTSPEEGRSSVYSTDVAKMIQIPIFHVNGDDPDAVYNVLQIALDYRQRFHKDVVIDVIGFRRHGHNEGDEPSYTQPVMYKQVRAHPGVRDLYARRLVRDGVMTQAAVGSLMDERTRRYENALLGAKEIVARQKPASAPGSTPGRIPGSIPGSAGLQPAPPSVEEPQPPAPLSTGVDHARLLEISRVLTTAPREFNLNPKVTGLLARRAKMVEGALPVDWGMAEALSFGSLLLDGTPIRLAGQDTVRGTFSHRHAAFFDTQTDQPWIPLRFLEGQAGSLRSQGIFQIYDSPLSEAGVLGFEYGYSVASPKTLVLWEAQFGDFVNAAQVMVDQFVAAGEEKWDQKSALVMLLPHGYEGQGPEHSSARLERFLQLAARDNMRIAYPSTSAQYFHLLRRQAMQRPRKPLIVMTPKSLLRLPEAASPIEEFTAGSFRTVVGDEQADRSGASRVLVCSGKIYFELAARRKDMKEAGSKTGIFRIEQFYPFPNKFLAEHLASLSKATEIVWVQEEPANMGGWTFMEPRLRKLLRPGQSLKYIGRPENPSPATGSHTVHQMEQRELVSRAFSF